MVSKLKQLSDELRRRHVYKVGAAYMAVGLGVLGAAELILDPLGLGSARPIIVILTLLGFPLALVLAWAYDVKPDSSTERAGSVRPVVPAEKAPDGHSIVVLPFANLSPDPEAEYFADGMTEEIINAIANNPRLRVIARTSAFSFKGSNRDVREIGRELGVTSVLEGSVRRAGSQLRITAQLIDVSGGHHLWSERYDREFADVFAIQDEIARIIARRLQATGPERLTISPPTDNLDAYEAFLRGRFSYEKGTPEAYSDSVKYYEQAIALDPRFAQAHAGLAEAYGFWAFITESADRFPKSKAAASRAIELDESLADAYGILGWITFFADWDWNATIRFFDRAIELNPNSPRANQFAGGALANLDPVKALPLATKGIELDPLSPLANQTFAWVLFQNGRFSDSIQFAEKALQIAPDFLLAHLTLSFPLLETGQLEKAEETFERMLDIRPGEPRAQAGLVRTYVETGRLEAAENRAAELERSADHSKDDFAVSVAWAHAALGNLDQSFEWTERAIRDHDGFLPSIARFSWWRPLYGDPRFEAVLRRLAFPLWSYQDLLGV